MLLLLLFQDVSSLYYCHKLSDVFKQLLQYSIKLCIGVTISVSLALSTCVLFISLMQSVNGVQFLNTTFFIVIIYICTLG